MQATSSGRPSPDYNFASKNSLPMLIPRSTVKPKPRFVPDWRRNHSGGFLPGWLVTFALVLAAEWGLRRVWGMV